MTFDHPVLYNDIHGQKQKYFQKNITTGIYFRGIIRSAVSESRWRMTYRLRLHKKYDYEISVLPNPVDVNELANDWKLVRQKRYNHSLRRL